MDMMPGLLRLYVKEAVETLEDPSHSEISNYVKKRIDVPGEDLFLAVLMRGKEPHDSPAY